MDFLEDCSEVCFFDFRSYTPIGATDIRSVVYMKRWQKLMLEMTKYAVSETDGETVTIDHSFLYDCYGDYGLKNRLTMINDILGHTPSAHTCRLASTFIHWVARDADFLSTTGRLCRDTNANDEMREIIYQGYFNATNQRDRTFNSGRIPLDSLVYTFRTRADIPQFFYGPDDMETVHRNALDDMMTLNLMIKWLASDKGQDFIKGCEHNIKIKYDRKNATGSRFSAPTQEWLSKRPHSFP